MPVGRAAAVLVRTGIAELIRPVTWTISAIRRGRPWLRATLQVLPAAFSLWRNWRRPILRPGFRLSPPLRTSSFGVFGIPVSGRERVRPHWPELAQPLLGRGFAEVGLRPLVSGPPAEFHLCRHSAKKSTPPPVQPAWSCTTIRHAGAACRRRPARTQLDELGPSLVGLAAKITWGLTD